MARTLGLTVMGLLTMDLTALLILTRASARTVGAAGSRLETLVTSGTPRIRRGAVEGATAGLNIALFGNGSISFAFFDSSSFRATEAFLTKARVAGRVVVALATGFTTFARAIGLVMPAVLGGNAMLVLEAGRRDVVSQSVSQLQKGTELSYCVLEGFPPILP